jgi:hypothetical protein
MPRMNETNRKVSPDRKAIYYVGSALAVVGVVLFLSFFVTSLANFGNFENFNERAKSGGIRLFSGIVLIAIGQVLRRLGTLGLAGAGVVLDPERARKDVEPWSRMAGGIVNDALSEVPVVKGLQDKVNAAGQAVKVRCRGCRSLNDETAKFCNQCGAALQ